MPGDDQERFEDYLELEQFIAELQAGHVAHPPTELTPAQARIYRAAKLFHAATPGVSEPRPEFVEQLQARLEGDLQVQHEQPQPLVAQPRARRLHVSRRALLAGSALAAASVAAGVGLERVLEPGMPLSPSSPPGADIVPTNWFFVTTVAELGNQAVQFKTESLIGYVVRNDGVNGDPAERGQIIAMSAACTHMGCIVKWSGTERKFLCPCHAGAFTEDGGPDTDAPSSSLLYLHPLPRLEVQVKDGEVYVRMPASV